MKIGKITTNQTFSANANGQGRSFTGTDITAEFLNQNGYVDSVSFHYAYATNNYQGLVEKVIHTIQREQPAPENVTNIRVIPVE